MQPWSRQKELLKEAVPAPEEIVHEARSIQHDITRYLFILEYLTAGRVSEITGDVKHNNPGLTRGDFELKSIDGRKFLLINMPNRKNRRNKRKIIPVPLDKAHNAELCEMLFEYLNTFTDKTAKIFPFEKFRAWQLLHKYVGCNNHMMRHIRITHAIQHDDLSDSFIEMLAGWSDSRPLKNYKHLRWMDLVRKL